MSNPQKRKKTLYSWGASQSGREAPVNRDPTLTLAGAFHHKVLETATERDKRTRKPTPIPLAPPEAPNFRERNTRISQTSKLIGSLPNELPSRIMISTVSEKLLNEIAVAEINNRSEEVDYGTVNDPRMGTTVATSYCTTCHGIICPGHFGKITLQTPVINPMYTRIVIAILTCVCNKCGSILFPKDVLVSRCPSARTLTGWNLLNLYAKQSKGISCQNDVGTVPGANVVSCKGYTNPEFNIKASKDKNFVSFSAPGKSEQFVSQENVKTHYTASEVWDILNSISDDTARTIGFGNNSHPRDLVIRVLPVIPPIARPPIFTHGSMRSDQLTGIYSNIVDANNKIRENPNSRDGAALFEYITNLIIGETKRRVTYNQLVSILMRIKGKDALFRAAMQGKRVDYSARGVLSPGPQLEFGQLGVPAAVAEYFHMPITITPANYKYVISLLKAGRLVTHTPASGWLEGHKSPIVPGNPVKIQPGDQVERKSQDGDLVILNRQPTLHHGSFQAYYMVIVTDKTFLVHPASTTPHNADFDGDTGTVLYLRSHKSIQEALQLMHADRNIIDPKQNKPMVAPIMDSITSPYLMTKPDEGINPLIFVEVLQKMKTVVALDDLQARASVFGLHPWSGQTLFSALFPNDFYYRRGEVVIMNGILFNGRIKANFIGTSHRSIVQDMYKQYGYKRTSTFITDITWLTIAWLDTYGFSIGPADCDYGEDADEQRSMLLLEINSRIKSMGDFPTHPVLLDNYQKRLKDAFDEGLVFGNKLAVKTMTEETPVKGRQNAIGAMAKGPGAGAKADLFNIGQMGGSLGGQTYHGDIPKACMNQGQRFLPTQPLRDPARPAPAEERGYCRSSFRGGLTPVEFYYTAWATRGDLINTNLQTAVVGDAQRRMSKALESIIYNGNGTVGSITGPVYQFSYGGDGLSSKELMNVGTFDHGTVPTFCDPVSIADRLNAMGGWIRKEDASSIRRNLKYHALIDSTLPEGTPKIPLAGKEDILEFEQALEVEDEVLDQIERKIGQINLAPEPNRRGEAPIEPQRQYGIPQLATRVFGREGIKIEVGAVIQPPPDVTYDFSASPPQEPMSTSSPLPFVGNFTNIPVQTLRVPQVPQNTGQLPNIPIDTVAGMPSGTLPMMTLEERTDLEKAGDLPNVIQMNLDTDDEELSEEELSP